MQSLSVQEQHRADVWQHKGGTAMAEAVLDHRVKQGREEPLLH